MAESEILFELAVIFGLAGGLTLLSKLIKQPTIVAHILTGIIVGPLFLNVLKSNELIEIFASIGVTFLLFIVGLSLDFRVLKKTGKIAATIGVGQVVITSVIGFIIASLIGLAYIPAIYVAAALAISSTVIVMGILHEKKETNTLHSKISLGILIIQDFIAALMILLIPLIDTVNFSIILKKLLIGGGLTVLVFTVSILLMPRVIKIATRNQEVLLLFSVTWAFLIAMLFNVAGISIEFGALIGGMALASSKFSLEISSKIKGIRDFFIIVHLIFFGTLLVGPITSKLIVNASIFSALVLIGNPIIIMGIMKLFKYTKNINFLTGITIAQISELSLIIAFLGFSQGSIDQEIFSLLILVALITIIISTYGLIYSKKLYSILSPILNIFDGKIKEDKRLVRKQYNTILFGYNRIGFNILKSLNKKNKNYLVIDYNPDVIEKLESEKVDALHGDANDLELLKELKLNNAKLIISTIPELSINLDILSNIRNKKINFIATSESIEDTQELYKAGANYVIMPHFLGGNYIASLLSNKHFGRNLLKKESQKQLKELSERLEQGHKHPNDKNQ